MARPYSIDLSTLPRTVLEYQENLDALKIRASPVRCGDKHIHAAFPGGWAHTLESFGSFELHNFYQQPGGLALTVVSRNIEPLITQFHFWTLACPPKNGCDLLLSLLEAEFHLD